MSTSPLQLAYISLEQIAVDMEFGIAPSEIGKVQRVLIDVTVGIDDKNTHILDSPEGLLKGFDYSTVYVCVMDAAKSKPKLMETFANQIAESVLSLPKVLECEVTINKTRVWANVANSSLKIKRYKK